MSLFHYKASNIEISKIIDQLDNKSSSGDDNISNLVVKQSKIEIVPILTFLINKSFRDGVFPEALKKAEVLPLFKEGSKIKESNYRPISLLNVWSKIFERAMFNRMSLYLERFCLIYKKQFGFRKKHCIDALVEMTEKIRFSNFEKRLSFFLDLKKAFDTLDHEILLQKLEKYGFRGTCQNWLHSYLENRSERVVANGVVSHWQIIRHGVPQGSILGPLLFLIYIFSQFSRNNAVRRGHKHNSC